MAAGFVGKMGRGRRRKGEALIFCALCLGLKALESKGVFGTGMEKIWLSAKVRENL